MGILGAWVSSRDSGAGNWDEMGSRAGFVGHGASSSPPGSSVVWEPHPTGTARLQNPGSTEFLGFVFPGAGRSRLSPNTSNELVWVGAGMGVPDLGIPLWPWIPLWPQIPGSPLAPDPGIPLWPWDISSSAGGSGLGRTPWILGVLPGLELEWPCRFSLFALLPLIGIN